MHYDELNPKAQAERRQVWSDGIDRRIEGLDLRSELEASGVPYSSLDQNGKVVTHYPGQRTLLRTAAEFAPSAPHPNRAH